MKGHWKVLRKEDIFLLLPCLGGTVLLFDYSSELFLMFAAGLIGLLLLLIGSTRPIIPLLAYVFSIPLEEVASLPGLGTLSRLLGLIFALSYVLHRGTKLNIKAVSGWAWVYLIWATASLTWSVEPAWDGYFNLLQLMIMMFLVADLIGNDEGSIKWILFTAVIAAVLAGSLGLYAFVRSPVAFVTGGRVSALEGQSVAHFGLSLITGFLTCFGVIFFPGLSYLKRAALVVCFMILLAAILASGTRSAWMGVAIGVFIGYSHLFSPRNLLAFGVVAALGAIALFSVPATSSIPSKLFNASFDRAGSAVSSGGAGRTDIWHVGVGIFLDHPVLGVGYRNFEKAFNYNYVAKSPIPIEGNVGENRPPHNHYLGTATDLGLIGLVLLVGWFGALIPRPLPRSGKWMIVSTILLAYLISASFSNVQNRKYFYLVLAMAEGGRCLRGRNSELKRKSATSFAPAEAGGQT